MALLHLGNILLLFGITAIFIHYGSNFGSHSDNGSPQSFKSSWEVYGWFSLVLYLCQYLALLALPQAVFNFLGFILFNPFPADPQIKKSIQLPDSVPFICFRVVTRGDYSNLVQNNVKKNIDTCLNVGLQNFIVEVVADRSISLNPSQHACEVVVPVDYQTKSGAMFKARALQYCLEKGVNRLNDDDWVVHLDEETVLTASSVKGIINFVCNGKHKFGQGLITYAHGKIVNQFTTLCDTLRVAEDMGKIQFQLRVLRMPILGWKGSFVVSHLGSERKVSFDNGRDSSVAEDTYFGIRAASLGYSFDFIQGDMHEQSPFTLMDFLQQRKRWLQGLLLVAHSSYIPFRYRFLLGVSVYSWITMPLTTANLFLKPVCPIAIPHIVDISVSFIGGVWMFLYIYGTCRSFSIARLGIFKFLLLLMAGVFVTPFKVVVENIAVLWGLLTPKHKFFVVKKDLNAICVI
ncbi:beta-1,4-mannosyltransferase egh-like [Daphnia pulex]|uniref:beta-1,4-mannosyltransferase egh-like n=1 Tax=Daphnia pulex TaxID=6669 RepID=UPI001EDEEBA9|nr:beta-1,4-mannosyltransferase egh-like [Daphnia pulex]XP_046451310.1 beta-1,4-mannosyltransferase egh-like [Daphnia pulex]XP_046451311.1 beta-1,4-mannosyltransferase egh-like [Daphnia pulex]